jgi:HAD superfamily hydrolase (TIGR01509 family)
MIKAIITDFDGTLVDTFEANFRAYKKAFEDIGRQLTNERYRECFGYRFDRFMQVMEIDNDDDREYIRKAKMKYYPEFFNYLKPNIALIQLIAGFRALGGKTAIASTAQKENLMNVVSHCGLVDYFDLILTGADVKMGKPNPEIYLNAMAALGVSSDETLIFEDSQIGIDAAKASQAQCMIVTSKQFE